MTGVAAALIVLAVQGYVRTGSADNTGPVTAIEVQMAARTKEMVGIRQELAGISREVARLNGNIA